MDYTTLVLTREGPIATLMLNRPPLNAITGEMFQELPQALDEVAADPQVRVLVLTAAGDRAFCVGADIKGPDSGEARLARMRPEEIRLSLRRGAQGIARRLVDMDIPTIASINGVAASAGLDWALACDLRLASDRARFKVAFTSLGVVSPYGEMWLLARTVGIARAKEMVFTDDIIDAQEAYRIGLVNWVVPHADLRAEARALAEKIAKGPPAALKHAKLMIDGAFEHSFKTSLEMAALAQGINLRTQDHQEGMAGFAEKRERHFRGE